MDSNLLGYISLGTQALSSGLGGLFTNNSIKKENQKNREWNEKMWNLTNEYNSPKSQMARYLEAGLNPNLVYGSTQNSLASYAGNLGTSENFKNPSENVNAGVLFAGKQLDIQEKVANSEIRVNEAKESDLIAHAEELRSRIPSNLSNNMYLNKLIQMQDNENAWYNISLPAKTAMLDLQQAIMAGNADMIVQQTKRLTQQTTIDKQMADLQTYAVNNAVELQWKHYNLSKQELGAKIELWLKEGDAAIRNSKANFLNALTNGKLASLKEKEFNKFSDAELDLLEQKATQLRTNNAWADMLNENQFRLGTKILEGKSYENQKQMLDLINYYNQMMMDFTGSIFSSSYKF